MLAKLWTYAGVFSGVPFSLAYGAIARFVFGSPTFRESGFAIVSLAFLVFAPIAIGALTVYFAPADKRASLPYAFFAPCLSCFIAALLAGILAIEVAICIAMALPFLFSFAMLGGIATWFVQSKIKQADTPTLGAILLLPFLVAPIEARFPVADSWHVVHTQIEINAPEEVVWQNITRVPEIKPGERPPSLLFDVFGAPRPLEAKIFGDGVGVMRQGIFAGGLSFDERITVWEPYRQLNFEITAQNNLARSTLVSLAPWNEIGGKVFAVPQAGYRLEKLSNGHVLLHLTSTHRLTTRFNDYGGLWTGWGMREFQMHILQIIKARCEAQ